VSTILNREINSPIRQARVLIADMHAIASMVCMIDPAFITCVDYGRRLDRLEVQQIAEYTRPIL
jgi:hypothetical protein